jgi:hypothetical protein
VPRRFLYALLILTTPIAAFAESADPPAALNLGTRLELFVDDFLIESLDGLELKLHHPRSAGKVLTLDKPWEGATCDYQVVIKDQDRYRMYYRGSSHKGYTIPSFLKPGEVVQPEHPQYAVYVESQDGISWTRPNLGIVEFNGSKENNIILGKTTLFWRVTDPTTWRPFETITPRQSPPSATKRWEVVPSTTSRCFTVLSPPTASSTP